MELDFRRLSRGKLYVLVALSMLSILLGFVGWMLTPRFQEAIGHGHWTWVLDAAFRALKSWDMPEVYDKIQEDGHDNVFLEVSRIAGIIVKPYAIYLVVLALGNERQIAGAARKKRDHVIIAGDSPFADRLGESLQDRAVHLCAPEARPHRNGRTIRLPYAAWRAHVLEQAGVRRATKLVIAPRDDAAAIELALETRQLFPKLQTYVRINDYGLSQRLQQIPGAERVRAFSDSAIAARAVVRRHPPFLLAQDGGYKRIHALLMGDHDWLEALMAEILASACTLTFGRPTFSFVCDHAADFEERLVQRYPELSAAADLAFYPAGKLTEIVVSRANLDAIGSGRPITCAYIALAEQTEVLSASITFRDLASKDATFVAPIFVRVHSPNVLTPKAPGVRLEPLSLVPFGSPEDIARAMGLLSDRMDSAERTYHEAYLQSATPGSEANKPWDELNEEYRLSNFRAVAHINAKLFEAGFDVRDWMGRNPDIWANLPALAPGQRLWQSAGEFTRLAELEHERWIVDRRLNGWSYGSERDNARKLHPDIIPFADLSEDIQRYDYAFVEQLADILGTRIGGIVRV